MKSKQPSHIKVLDVNKEKCVKKIYHINVSTKTNEYETSFTHIGLKRKQIKYEERESNS